MKIGLLSRLVGFWKNEGKWCYDCSSYCHNDHICNGKFVAYENLKERLSNSDPRRRCDCDTPGWGDIP